MSDAKRIGTEMDPTVEVKPGDVQDFNIVEYLFGDAGLPTAALQDDVIELQASGRGDDDEYKAADYTPIGALQQGQGYQQPSFPVEAAGGPGPSTGFAAVTSHYIDLSGGELGEAVAGSSAGVTAGSSVHVNDKESGVPISRPRKRRDAHNLKERTRRARLKTSWASLRQIVPGLNAKTDNASVCERAVEYTRHMNEALVATYGQEAADNIGRAFYDKFQPY